MVKPFWLDESAFIIPTELSTFKSLYMARRPCMQGQFMTYSAKKVFDRIANFYSSPSDKRLKLYMSRRGVNRRVLQNEEEVEDIFIKAGFTIIQPAILPFPEQVRLAASATHIAGPISSAMHLALFAKDPSQLKVLFLSPRGFPSINSFFDIERFYKRVVSIIYGAYVSDFHKKSLYHVPWKISLENLRCGLQQWLSA